MAEQKKLSELNKGAWSGTTDYTVGDIVSHNGSSYICVANSTNNTPPNATYWALLSSKGDKGDKGDTGETGLQGEQGIQGIQGIQGVKGDQGIQGEQGDPGLDGKTVLSGTVAPTSEGVDGDFYINTTTNEIYGPKTDGSWGSPTSLVGPTGPEGPAGPGSGDVLGPATNTADYLPQWNGANSKTLKNGVPVPAGGLAGLTALGDKVDKVAGKGLSTNDYTDAEKTKLGGIAAGATVGADWNTNVANKPTIPSTLASLSDDTTHRTVTDTEKTTWNGKQDALVSATNIKTVNGNSLLGSGDLAVSGVSVTTKGDLQGYSTTAARIPVGSNGQALFANSGVASGLQYLNFLTRGQLINGKIVPSVSSNNLTVAIKTLAGNDPSATDPVFVRLGDSVLPISAALSKTLNAGTNWFNSGGTPLATKEVDYFVYLGYNTTDGVVMGFSPLPFAYIYSDFSTTTTNQKYCAISTVTNAVAGDCYEVVGRFAATLSAGAGYTWTVPTFTNGNLIQSPIRQTRLLFWNTGLSSGSMTFSNIAEIGCYYQLKDGECQVKWGRLAFTTGGSVNGTVIADLPKTAAAANDGWTGASAYSSSAYKGAIFTESTTTTVQIRLEDATNWAAGANYFGGKLSFILG